MVSDRIDHDAAAGGTAELLLEARGITKRFPGVVANADVSLQLHRGEILALLGEYGAWKSTLVKMLFGLYRPDEGEVSVLGTDPAMRPTAQRTAIGYLPQSPVLFDDLSLWENLNYHASLNGVPWRRRRRLHEVLELVELEGEERKLVRESSGGMRRRLALAATLVHDPALLILDEPTAGIDPLLRRQIWEHFRLLSDRDRTVVLTTQHVNEAAHCDVVVVLDEGRVVAIGSPDELRRSAFGGDVARLRFASVIDDRVVAELHDAGCISVESIDTTQVRIVVEQASSDLPGLLRRFETLDIGIEESAEVPVDWDETFIALVGPKDES